jgi:hypothetical protein
MKKLALLFLALVPSVFADTLTTTAATSSGTVSAGAIQITFVASSDFVGTIDGAFPIPASAGFTATATNGSGGLDAIPYTRTAGTLYIMEVRK